jgi:hypothetical protein
LLLLISLLVLLLCTSATNNSDLMHVVKLVKVVAISIFVYVM